MNIALFPILRSSVAVGILMFVLILTGCTKQDPVAPTTIPNPGGNPPIASPIPKTPPQVVIPSDNNPIDLTAEIELGRHLFFDTQMSVDNTTSCASCHQPARGFADAFPFSQGMQGQHGTRNAPGLTNVAFNSNFTWDGKFPSLEKHAPGPIFNSLEMGNNFSSGFDSSGNGGDTVGSGYNSKPGNNDTLFLFARIDGDPKARSPLADAGSGRKDVSQQNYYALLNKAWGPVPVRVSTDGGKTFSTQTKVAFTMDIIAKSIAAYERTFISTSSAFDRYNAGDATAMNQYAIHGFQLFIDPNKANCVSCHSGYNFTDQQFHNNGGATASSSDIGRAGITKQDSDQYKFKTPTLRNVGLTKPYFHNGYVDGDDATKALNILVSNYNAGGLHTKNQDSRVTRLNLSDQDVSDIVEFLKELTDSGFGYSTNFTNPWK